LLIALNCILILQHFQQQKREENGKCKYKRAAQENKESKKKSEVIASFVSSILQYMSC
jgi:hypothetical protein